MIPITIAIKIGFNRKKDITIKIAKYYNIPDVVCEHQDVLSYMDL